MGIISLPFQDSEESKPFLHYRHTSRWLVITLSIIGLSGFFYVSSSFRAVEDYTIADSAFRDTPRCPRQPEPLIPLLAFDVPAEYTNQSAARLSQAIQIPTISYDDNGSPEDDVGLTFYYYYYAEQNIFTK